ncbi:right-handed parallel beta-helix repeat-containing protein [Streptomyces sp. NPDC057963]|uniref:right-handed parallel beta-helix repeat-containing protein n=1 Tax=Streptomyces sp. NPDC057963 TaxID=3346290 RepID=UPI0036EE59E2
MNRRWPAYLLAGVLGVVAPLVGAASPAAAATVINVATTGADTPGCGSAAAPCASIPFAYNEAAPGDTIRVQAGTYVMTTPLVIRKADLHFQGAQAGVDARTRTPGGPGETVITTTLNTPIQEDMWIAQANGVSIDGFTFTGNADGAGVTTSENFSGYQVENNIFSNNLKGFAPSSDGAVPSVFQQNLFINNNNATLHPGSQGNGVFTFRPLANATFSHNKFQDNGNAPINIAGGEVPGATKNITIADNNMDGEFPVVFVVVSDAVVTRNSMIGGFSGVQVSGACHNIAITHNTIADKTHGGILLFTGFAAVTNTDITVADNAIERTGTVTGRFGVEISNTRGVTLRNNRIIGSGHDAIGFTLRGQTTPSSDATITQNTITGSGGSGIFVADGAYSGPMTVHYNRIVDSGSGNGLVNNDPGADIDARFNWWGCNDMPNGTGCDHVAGTAVGQIDFRPWLVLTIHSVPADIAAGQQAQITASLQNDSDGGTPAGPFFHPVLTTFTANPGVVTPSQVVTNALLHAITTWPAGQPRPELICAVIDHEKVCLNFEVTGSIALKKRVVTPGPYTVGKKVQYSYTVTNTGSTDLHGVLVRDNRVTKVTCDATTLAPGASTTCRGTYTITQADADACKKTRAGGGDGKLCPVTNVAVAAGTDPQGNQVASEPAEVTIDISKPRPPKPPHHKPPHKKPGHKRSYNEVGSDSQEQI